MDETDIIWEISPHTEAKHSILKRYIQAWAPILAQGSRDLRLIYIDGFAGPGEYRGGEEGSPVVVLKALKEHVLRDKFQGTEFVNIFIEEREDRCKNLEKSIKERVGELPNWIKYEIKNNDFNSQVREILRKLESEGNELAPSLCFIDPFGWSDLDYDVMSGVMKYDKSELFITFMAGFLQRFVFDPLHQKSIEKLYSKDQIEEIRNSGNSENLVLRYFLENLKNKIEENGYYKPIFDLSFAAYNKYNKLEYYLIYVTKGVKGMDAMKKAMFKSAGDGSYKFSDFGFNPSQKSLVDYTDVGDWTEAAAKDVYEILIEMYKHLNHNGRKIPMHTISDIVTTKSKWYFNKKILRWLEEEGKIDFIADKRRKWTYPERGYVILK